MSDDGEMKQWWIMDSGSGQIQAGLSSEGSSWGPSVSIKSCVGKPLYEKLKQEVEDVPEYYVGEQLESNRGLMSLQWATSRGSVQNWDAMEALWDEIEKNQFRIVAGGEDADIAGVFLLEPCLNDRSNREKVSNYFFEKAGEGEGVNRIYFGLQAVLTLVGRGDVTGCCVNAGGGVTEVVPIFQSYPMRHAYQRIAWAGTDVTQWLGRELHKSGIALETSADALIVEKIKEEVCKVSLNYDEEREELNANPKDYTLPDATTIQLREEIVTCSEVLFNPILAGKDLPGHHQLCMKAINACPMDTRASLLGTIVVAGGTSMFQNYEERLKAEMTAMCGETAKIKVIAPPERSILAMLGANILCGLSTFQGESGIQTMWVPKSEYNEVGARCVHRMSQS
jgi:actin-related protein